MVTKPGIARIAILRVLDSGDFRYYEMKFHCSFSLFCESVSLFPILREEYFVFVKKMEYIK